MRILYLDVFAGISGDMMLGALHDLGAPLDTLHEVVRALDLADEVSVAVQRTSKHQIGATYCRVTLQAGSPRFAHERSAFGATSEHADHHGHQHPHDDGHAHDHEHPHDHRHPHPHDDGGNGSTPGSPYGEIENALTAVPPGYHSPERPYRSIAELLERAPLADGVRARARRAFGLLAEAEAEVHGVTTEDVTFHEVGGADAIVDIVGACALLETFAPDQIVCSPIPLARSVTRGAHGALPIPAPATLNLLRARGAPVRGVGGPDQTERVTPTGAALAMAFADEFGPIPPGRIVGIGYGAGMKDFASVPNLLRMILMESIG